MVTDHTPDDGRDNFPSPALWVDPDDIDYMVSEDMRLPGWFWPAAVAVLAAVSAVSYLLPGWRMAVWS